jgi:hypothetical protein
MYFGKYKTKKECQYAIDRAIDQYGDDLNRTIRNHRKYFSTSGADNKVTSSTKYLANMVSASDDGADESEWYDWWNDVDGYLLNYDPEFKQIIYDFRNNYGWPKDMSDPLCDKLGDEIYIYVKTNADKLGIDTSENTDADYSEFANERMIEWLIEPELYGNFWDDYKG